MNSVKSAVAVEWPDADLVDNFKFSAIHSDGTFTFTFRYFNGRWNGWCELPSGEIRVIGVEPFVPSWTGFTDYGIIFDTDLTSIDQSSLFLTTMYILTWE